MLLFVGLGNPTPDSENNRHNVGFKIIDKINKEFSLTKQKPVELRDFGRFSIKTTKAKYNARNPKTGEIIYVPEKKKVSFKMSKHLKQEINKKT